MAYIFGKTINTAKGEFKAGQPLPPEWTGKETVRQLRETFGEDVLVTAEGEGETLRMIGARLAAVEKSLEEIKEALSVGASKKKSNA